MAVEIALQALRALRFLHAKGYIHRDIAPDNLMLTRDAEGQLLVKLIDLGIVKILRDETQKSVAGIYLGKPRYSSPEQLMGKELDGRSDLYSFGILLFELLTGRYPIRGQDFASLVTGHLYRPPLAFDEADPGRPGAAGAAPADREVDARRTRPTGCRAPRSSRGCSPACPSRAGRTPTARRLGALLAGIAAARRRRAGRPPRGTTQEELDRHFDRARATPSPATIEELASRVAPAPAAAPRSQRCR